MSLNSSPLRWVALVAAVVLGAAALAVQAAAPSEATLVKAVCSGGPLDAAKVQAKIDGSAVGDEIVFSGTCSLTATIELLGGRSYRGNSRTTTLRARAGSNLAAVVASDSWLDDNPYTGEPVTVRDLTIDGNAAANPTGGDGLVIRSWQTTLENLTIRGARGNGLRLTSRSRGGVDLVNTQVNGSVRGIFVRDSGQNGIFIEDRVNALTDWNLSDSWIADSGLDGIRSDNAAGWTIERNHIYGVGRAAIWADRLYATAIDGNYIEDFETAGISTTVQGDAASTIANNRVFRFTGAGTTFIAIRSVNYGAGQVAVTGNVVRGSGIGTALSYQRGSYDLTVSSVGNLVSGVAVQRQVGAGVIVVSGI